MDKNEIQNLIKDLLEKATIPVKEITIIEKEGKGGSTGATWFSVETTQPYHLIGRGGDALFALNHLVKKIVESKNINKDLNNGAEGIDMRDLPAILVDVNGFQQKRIENIHAIAHMMAERARYFKSSVEVDPMPAFERRIVHEFLSEENDLKTESTGDGLARRVVIKYIGTI
ncbi:MAG: R3H domain-containing nucleic acid-binding protein [bacterium]